MRFPIVDQQKDLLFFIHPENAIGRITGNIYVSVIVESNSIRAGLRQRAIHFTLTGAAILVDLNSLYAGQPGTNYIQEFFISAEL